MQGLDHGQLCWSNRSPMPKGSWYAASFGWLDENSIRRFCFSKNFQKYFENAKKPLAFAEPLCYNI